MASKGLDIELRKKFQGLEFKDFFELAVKVVHYKELFREESQKKKESVRNYYQEENYDVSTVELVVDESYVCPAFIKAYGKLDKKTELGRKTSSRL